MDTLPQPAPGVHPASTPDILWWSARPRGEWHDQDAAMECGYTDADCTLDFARARWADPDGELRPDRRPARVR